MPVEQLKRDRYSIFLPVEHFNFQFMEGIHLTNTNKYKVSLGFTHWIYFNVNASSKDKAYKKAIKMYENGENYDGTDDERNGEFDVTELLSEDAHQ